MNFGGFSWKRLLGITRVKQNISRKIGIPLTRGGRQRKIGAALEKFLFNGAKNIASPDRKKTGSGCMLAVSGGFILVGAVGAALRELWSRC
jgi:hypothetical protein